jgi:leucyl aminopeptidase
MPAFLSHTPLTDESVGADLLIVPVTSSAGDLPRRLGRLGRGVVDATIRAIDLGDFEPSTGRKLLVHSRGFERFPRILLVGLGAPADRTPAGVRKVFIAAAKDPVLENVDSVVVLSDSALGSGRELSQNVTAAVDGLAHGTYRWSAATTPKGPRPGRFAFLGETRTAARVESGVERGRVLASAVSLARTLANEPANRMSPAQLADRARTAAKKAGLTARVLGKAALVRERCEGILTVGGGSAREPRLIVLEYDPGASGSGLAPIALVGKGLVFDTGGLNIKPGSSMGEMKFDKCGACVVIGAMSAIAELAPPFPVVAVVPAVENSISGESYRPGDVIGSRSGKTIEVLNTDAEGRIVLADGLDYAVTKYSPRAVIDVATLTGAAYHALGDHACPLIGNDDGLVERLHSAGEAVGEPVWRLPLWDAYRRDVDTPNADVRNTGAGGAGSIAGAAFLERFVGDVPWAHLDIANVSRDRRDPKIGATGFGVRLLVESLMSWPRPRRRGRAGRRTKRP